MVDRVIQDELNKHDRRKRGEPVEVHISQQLPTCRRVESFHCAVEPVCVPGQNI
jgi:hypothetical protein